MTSNVIYIVALGVGFKCPHKINLNTQCPPRFWQNKRHRPPRFSDLAAASLSKQIIGDQNILVGYLQYFLWLRLQLHKCRSNYFAQREKLQIMWPVSFEKVLPRRRPFQYQRSVNLKSNFFFKLHCTINLMYQYSRCLIVSTDQADPSCSYLRIS